MRGAWSAALGLFISCVAVGSHAAEPVQTTPASQEKRTSANEKETEADHVERPRFNLRDGRVKLELSGLQGLDSGSNNRNDEEGIMVAVEYEVPVVKHLTVSARAMPLFFWHQDAHEDSDNVYAFGLGPVLRVYHKGLEMRGFYGEIGILAIAQTSKFAGNSGSINFLSEGGVGWMFKNGLHAGVKIQHISNAGLADRNQGVNLVGIAAGYTFRRDRRH